jgi:SAM-dependent methyltransferase
MTNIMQHVNPDQKNIHITCFDAPAAFYEVIKSLEYALLKLGFNVEISQTGSVNLHCINIIFAAHAMRVEHLQSLGLDLSKVIIYNLEQVGTSVPWMSSRYFWFMKQVHVWEYSSYNAHSLNLAGITNMSMVPIGYTPNLEDANIITPNTDITKQDIDVFFYGTMSERRRKAIQALRATGLKVEDTEHVQYIAQERANMIARSKIILNMHYYEDAHIFEIVRTSYLMANKKAIVSELGIHTSIDKDIKDGICHGNIDQLPQLCVDLINDPQKLQALAQKGYETITSRDYVKYVELGMENYFRHAHDLKQNINQQSIISIPKTLNLGCGNKWKYDEFNMDIDNQYKPDLVIDISQPIDFDNIANHGLSLWRFGTSNNLKAYFSHIYVNNVFEYVDDIAIAMTNCLNLLEVGGTLELKVTYDLSASAWREPGYKRSFNETSFFYYTNAFDSLKLNWIDYIFDIEIYTINLSPYGSQKLSQHDNNLDAVRNESRVIDQLIFKLRKRELNTQERQAHYNSRQ